MNNKKSLFLSVIGILGLIAITIGVTYAFFSYAKEGTTDNTITTGTITFLYTEVSGVGKGISLIDSYPISDSQGKNLIGEGKVFDFKVTSTNNMNASIPYEITARKKTGSTLDEEAVRIYLTKVSGTSEEEVLLDNYSNLEQTSKISKEKQIEKTLYTSKVPASVGEYEQAYRLRMWIDESTDFSPVEDSEGNITYPYNNKTFTVTVNVYANAKVVTEEQIKLENSTEISNLSVDDTILTSVENKDYDYVITLPNGTTNTTINVETTNSNEEVKVEKIASIA